MSCAANTRWLWRFLVSLHRSQKVLQTLFDDRIDLTLVFLCLSILSSYSWVELSLRKFPSWLRNLWQAAASSKLRIWPVRSSRLLCDRPVHRITANGPCLGFWRFEIQACCLAWGGSKLPVLRHWNYLFVSFTNHLRLLDDHLQPPGHFGHAKTSSTQSRVGKQWTPCEADVRGEVKCQKFVSVNHHGIKYHRLGKHVQHPAEVRLVASCLADRSTEVSLHLVSLCPSKHIPWCQFMHCANLPKALERLECHGFPTGVIWIANQGAFDSLKVSPLRCER